MSEKLNTPVMNHTHRVWTNVMGRNTCLNRVNTGYSVIFQQKVDRQQNYLSSVHPKTLVEYLHQKIEHCLHQIKYELLLGYVDDCCLVYTELNLIGKEMFLEGAKFRNESVQRRKKDL